jgi:hypothetical protein
VRERTVEDGKVGKVGKVGRKEGKSWEWKKGRG